MNLDTGKGYRTKNGVLLDSGMFIPCSKTEQAILTQN